MKWTLIILLTGMLLFPGSVFGAENANAGEKAGIEKMFSNYRSAWLAGDEAGVLKMLSDDVQIFVPGANGGKLRGINAVRGFWFPESDVRYPIRSYQISDREIYVDGDLAVVTGRSTLDWDTVEEGRVTASASSNSEFMSILKREDGEWRIFRQMYQMR
ncbi:MAG: nuclear transport factor 2 family protein [Xanthomonadales bacterium]|nr:nuclear transport factor 2 family protein [Xanthomonadales bacterium]